MKIYTLLFIFISFFSLAQVGIGTTNPDSSTVLEVSSLQKNGGILLPKIALKNATDNTTIPNPARGLLVYNLANAGTEAANNIVYANNIYTWNGAKWNVISDFSLAKKTLLPPVFFAQLTARQDFSGTDLTNLNNGTGVTVTYPDSSVLVNNGGNIQLSNNQFIIKTAGQYELSSFVNYCPRILSTEKTNLEFRIQRSNDNGVTWSTIATTREVWGEQLGSFFRSMIMPPSVIQNLNVNDRIRLQISKAGFGVNHGTGTSGFDPAISVGDGLTYSKNIKFLKLN